MRRGVCSGVRGSDAIAPWPARGAAMAWLRRAMMAAASGRVSAPAMWAAGTSPWAWPRPGGGRWPRWGQRGVSACMRGEGGVGGGGGGERVAHMVEVDGGIGFEIGVQALRLGPQGWQRLGRHTKNRGPYHARLRVRRHPGPGVSDNAGDNVGGDVGGGG